MKPCGTCGHDEWDGIADLQGTPLFWCKYCGTVLFEGHETAPVLAAASIKDVLGDTALTEIAEKTGLTRDQVIEAYRDGRLRKS